MSEDTKYSEYLKETVAGAQVCAFCKKSEAEIEDRLEGHASWCKWRKDMEELRKRGSAGGPAKEKERLKSLIKRHER